MSMVPPVAAIPTPAATAPRRHPIPAVGATYQRAASQQPAASNAGHKPTLSEKKTLPDRKLPASLVTLESGAVPEPASSSDATANPFSVSATIPLDDFKAMEELLLPRELLRGAGPPPVEPAVILPSPSPAAEAPAESPGREPVEEAMPADPAGPQSPPRFTRWPLPAALLEQIDELAHECETRAWALYADRLLGELGTAMEVGGEEAAGLLSELAGLREEADRLAGELGDAALAAKLRRAGFALDRRLAVWRQVLVAGGLVARLSDEIPRDPRRLAACLEEIGNLDGKGAEGRAWAKYLALDELRPLTGGETSAEDQGREIAKIVLRRLNSAPMNRRQREFVSSRPLASLRAELERWAVDSLELAEVLRHLEQYEQTGTSEHARQLADDCRQLALAPAAAKQELGRQLETYYRNANLRLAVTKELFSRLIPDRPPEQGCVSDVVLGNPVHGRSVTSTRVGVRLIPDRRRLRLALVINGLVSSLTHSTSGPATFFNDSQSSYRAWKEIELGPDGMRLRPAQVAVASDLRLHSLETDFDGFPLLGALVQGVARSQHEQRLDEMNSEVEEKVYRRAREQIDGEADARLTALADRVRTCLIDPLLDLALRPTIVAAETTDQRVTMRLRLASEEQLGGHTPRPRAPSDSLASLQVHESALNNLAEQLQLDGATFDVAQLRRRVASRLNRPELLPVPEDAEDLWIAFAAADAIQVRCREGRLEVTLSIARLTKDGQDWENFQARAFYRPEVTGRNAMLVRDDVVHLVAERISPRSQITLRGIFGRVFAKDRPIPLIPERVVTDPRMSGLVVTQLVLEDGWLGLALAADRPGRSPAVARRPGESE